MIKNARFHQINAKTGRKAFHIKCEHCKNATHINDVEVNHKETVGTLTMNNIGEHTERLLDVKEEDLELLCKPCHAIITYSERSGMTIEQSAVEKKVLIFDNKPAAEQKALMLKYGITPGKTKADRRLQARTLLRKKAGID